MDDADGGPGDDTRLSADLLQPVNKAGRVGGQGVGLAREVGISGQGAGRRGIRVGDANGGLTGQLADLRPGALNRLRAARKLDNEGVASLRRDASLSGRRFVEQLRSLEGQSSLPRLGGEDVRLCWRCEGRQHRLAGGG